MGYSEWRDRMHEAGYRTSYSSVKAYLATLPDDEIDRLLADDAAVRAAARAYHGAGGGKPMSWHDRPEAMELVRHAEAKREVMTDHARRHRCYLQTFLAVLSDLAKERAKQTV